MTQDKLQYLNHVNEDIQSLSTMLTVLRSATDPAKSFQLPETISIRSDSFNDKEITLKLCRALQTVVSHELNTLKQSFEEG